MSERVPFTPTPTLTLTLTLTLILPTPTFTLILRMRGFVYWRLLSADPECAKRVILSDRPEISGDAASFEPALLETLMPNIALLSSVFHQPPEFFVAAMAASKVAAPELVAEEEEEEEVKVGYVPK